MIRSEDQRTGKETPATKLLAKMGKHESEKTRTSKAELKQKVKVVEQNQLTHQISNQATIDS